MRKVLTKCCQCFLKKIAYDSASKKEQSLRSLARRLGPRRIFQETGGNGI